MPNILSAPLPMAGSRLALSSCVATVGPGAHGPSGLLSPTIEGHHRAGSAGDSAGSWSGRLTDSLPTSPGAPAPLENVPGRRSPLLLSSAERHQAGEVRQSGRDSAQNRGTVRNPGCGSGLRPVPSPRMAGRSVAGGTDRLLPSGHGIVRDRGVGGVRRALRRDDRRAGQARRWDRWDRGRCAPTMPPPDRRRGP